MAWTSIPDRTGARVWNHPGERQPADDLTRTQSTRPISLTPLAQTREEVTELRGMAERELAEHRANARERNQQPSGPSRGMPNPLNLRDFSTPDLSYSGLYEIDTGLQGPRSTSIQPQNGYTERPGEPRTRTPPLGHPTSENRTPPATGTFQQTGFGDPTGQARGYGPRGSIDADPRREDKMVLNETGTFQNYIKRNDAELKRIHTIMHMATSSAPDIDMRKTTPCGKTKIPEYAGNSDPKAHIRAFRLAISRAHLNDDEKEAGYCRFFAENLIGATLEEIKAKISHPNKVVALAALKNGVWFSSKLREEMAVRAPVSLDDALHRASYVETQEETVAALKEQYSANKNNAAKNTNAPKESATKGQHSYAINNSPQNKSSTYDLNKFCVFHNRKGHSTEECRAALRSQNENKETSEDNEEEDAPATPKTNRKIKGSSNKRNRETELKSPSSPPPAPKKRVDMISWGSKRDIPNKIEGQTEGKVYDTTQITLRSELLSQIRGSVAELRDRIHKELENLLNLVSFTEEEVMNFPNQRSFSPSICEYQISKGDSGPRKKRPEPKPIIGFKMDLSAFQKDPNQEIWPRNYEFMICQLEPKAKQLSSLGQETKGNSKTSNFIFADESVECPSRNQVTIDVSMELECFLSCFHYYELKENPKEAAKCSPHGKQLELAILNEPKMIPQPTSCPNQKHCKDHGLIVSFHHENFTCLMLDHVLDDYPNGLDPDFDVLRIEKPLDYFFHRFDVVSLVVLNEQDKHDQFPRRASTGERLRTCVRGTWNRTYLREMSSNLQESTMDLRTNPFEEGGNEVPQSIDQYMEPAQHGVQDVLNISTEVHVFHRTGQTNRAVYWTVPLTSEKELWLEPWPDDRSDRTRACLSRPTSHFKTYGRARIHFG
ncbi:hypothetical protein F2Q70_00017176 [Brassica cretica]|uniref:Uncharacterized protein n=1 Tax=Brassica cretica TaxID=69181 RepID=A0A8S9I2A9_BRACR|nr:hypothetical protein F2Q70_00017176 [Brassica cretica]